MQEPLTTEECSGVIFCQWPYCEWAAECDSDFCRIHQPDPAFEELER